MKTYREYRITISIANGATWCFRFQGNLNWFRRFFARLAGFTIKEVK